MAREVSMKRKGQICCAGESSPEGILHTVTKRTMSQSTAPMNVEMLHWIHPAARCHMALKPRSMKCSPRAT